MRRDEDYLQDLIESMFGLNNIMSVSYKNLSAKETNSYLE